MANIKLCNGPGSNIQLCGLSVVWENTGHTGTVYDVAVDLDGYVYSGAYNDLRKISPSGNQVWVYSGYSEAVNSVVVDNDGYVYTADGGYNIKKLTTTGSLEWSFDTGEPANGVAVDSNGNVFGGINDPFGVDDDTLIKLNSSGGEIWRNGYTGYQSTIYDVAVGPNDYIYGAGDEVLTKVDQSGVEVWHYGGYSGTVYAVAVDTDGYVYTGDRDNNVKKIDPSGSLVWTSNIHSDNVFGVAVDDNKNVYSCSKDKTAQEIGVWSYTNSESLNGIDVDLEGIYVYICGYGNTVKKLSYSNKIALCV